MADVPFVDAADDHEHWGVQDLGSGCRGREGQDGQESHFLRADCPGDNDIPVAMVNTREPEIPDKTFFEIWRQRFMIYCPGGLFDNRDYCARVTYEHKEARRSVHEN